MNKNLLFQYFTDKKILTAPKRKLDLGKPKAAVLVPLFEKNQALYILLTQRPQHLRTHAGQISFPGGRPEGTDHNLQETALRETEEEVGIHRSQVLILAELPRVESITGGGNLVTPFLGFIEEIPRTAIDPREVSAIIEMPLAFILDVNKFKRQWRILNNKRRYFYSLTFEDHYIWGVTALILYDLQRILTV